MNKKQTMKIWKKRQRMEKKISKNDALALCFLASPPFDPITWKMKA